MAQQYDFEAGMERITALTGARTQVELARLLGIRQSSVADAKKRGTIPSDWLLRLLRTYGANPQWIAYGEGQPFLVEAETPGAEIDEELSLGALFLHRVSARVLAEELVRRTEKTEE